MVHDYLILEVAKLLTIFRAMMHDEQYYPDPYTFNPDRYLQVSPLGSTVRGDASFAPDDPASLVFGFGRR